MPSRAILFDGIHGAAPRRRPRHRVAAIRRQADQAGAEEDRQAGQHPRPRRPARRGWRALQPSHPDLAQELREIHLLATANEVAVCGFLVCAAFTSRLWVEGLWVLMAMSCCLRNIAASLELRMQEVSSSSTSSPSAEQDLQPGLLIGQPRYT